MSDESDLSGFLGQNADKGTDKQPTRTAAPKPSKTVIRNALTANVGSLGLLIGVRCQQCGLSFVENTPPFVDAVMQLAEQDARVMRMLQSIVVGGGYLAVIAATASLVMPIILHHAPGMQGRAEPLMHVMERFQGDIPEQAPTDNGAMQDDADGIADAIFG